MYTMIWRYTYESELKLNYLKTVCQKQFPVTTTTTTTTYYFYYYFNNNNNVL